MDEFDRLPLELRRWLANAALPWSAASALRIWRRTLKKTGDSSTAIAHLKVVEQGTLCRETTAVWGQGYPSLHRPVSS
jgi:Family of unknown function (DUF6525)